MTVEVAVGVFVIVHALSVYLLRASGVWKILFARVWNLAPDAAPDPLRVAPRGWIENHSFWDLAEDEAESQEDDAELIFWGSRQRRAG